MVAETVCSVGCLWMKRVSSLSASVVMRDLIMIGLGVWPIVSFCATTPEAGQPSLQAICCVYAAR